MDSRYNFGLTRYRLPEDGEKFEPENVSFGRIEDALAKLAEWSEGSYVVLGAAEYAAMRASYEAALQGAAERDAPTTGEPSPEPAPPEPAVAAETTPEAAPESTAWGEASESGYATPPVPIDT